MLHWLCLLYFQDLQNNLLYLFNNQILLNKYNLSIFIVLLGESGKAWGYFVFAAFTWRMILPTSLVIQLMISCRSYWVWPYQQQRLHLSLLNHSSFHLVFFFRNMIHGYSVSQQADITLMNYSWNEELTVCTPIKGLDDSAYFGWYYI